MNVFRTRYRVISDNFKGFEAQFRCWWYPFWSACFFANSGKTLEEAKKVIAQHKNTVLWEE